MSMTVEEWIEFRYRIEAKETKKAKRLSQRQLAPLLGTHHPFLSRMRSRGDWTVDVAIAMEKLSDYLVDAATLSIDVRKARESARLRDEHFAAREWDVEWEPAYGTVDGDEA